MYRAIQITTMLILAICLCTKSNATLYRLDFYGQYSSTTASTGEVANSSYSGFLILDYDTPDGHSNDPASAFHLGMISQARIQVGTGSFVDSNSFPNWGIVKNDAVYEHDLLLFSLQGEDGNGDVSHFSIQFQDLSSSVFNSDQLPTSLNLDDFSAFDPMNTLSTGVFLTVNSNPLEMVFAPLEFAELHPVPLPSSFLLLVSSCMALVSRRTLTALR